MTLFDLETAETVEWEAQPEHEGERLDKHVAGLAPDDISRSQVQSWIRSGLVKVNGKPEKPGYRVAAGDIVELTVPEIGEAEIEPEPIPLDVVYEDGDVIVVNKPRGMVVHPAPGHSSGTLVNALMHHCRDLSGINGELRPGIVHRLDKDTSGLLMAAKNDRAHQSLTEQLKKRSVERRYLAIAHGVLPHDEGTVDAPIGRDPKDRKRFCVNTKTGKTAVTHFRVLERAGGCTILELRLETGRTHQIRVHMQFIGHPLVGDPVYGRSKGVTMNGQALHAATLGFDHPSTGERLRFEAPLPDDMKRLLELLRSS